MNKPITKLYKKKPVVVEAIQYFREENIFSVQDFVGSSMLYDADTNEYYIATLEGDMLLRKGDYIIKGIKGEFYPCKKDIFQETYEEVQHA